MRGCRTGRIDSRIVHSTSSIRTSLRIVVVVVDVDNPAKKTVLFTGEKLLNSHCAIEDTVFDRHRCNRVCKTLRWDMVRSRGLSLRVCSVSNVVEDRTCKVDRVAVPCACKRKGKVSCPTEHQMDGSNTHRRFNVSHLP